MDDLISRLSELRCQYNCFDENERDAYHTLSEAIKALSDVPGTNVGDMISKQAAIEEIKAVFEWHDTVTMERMVEHFKNLPSAQPEITRCKDCKNWDTTWTNDFSPNYHYCPMVDGVRKEDWYCADAERRTDE